MAEPIKIVLGGKEFTVRPLILDQIREFQPAILKWMGNFKEKQDFDYCIGAILVCLQRDNPEMTREAILKMEITTQELDTAAAELSFWSGILKKKEDGEKASGEATAATTQQ